MLETEGSPAEEAGRLRDLVRRPDPNQPIFAVRSMQDVYDLTVKQRMDIIREIIGGFGFSRVGAGSGRTLRLDELLGELAASRDRDPYGDRG